jgi:ABC-type cobalt transport system substrate-binding protein
METPISHQEHFPERSGRHLENYSSSWNQRISWPAVFAGLILAVFLQLALTFLGLSIGLSTIDAVGGDTPAKGLAIGSGVYSVLSMIFSLFTGGWVAGRLAKNQHTSESAIHGLLVAGLLFIFMIYMLSSAIGSVIGGAGKLAGSAISKVAPDIKNAVQDRYQPGTSAGKAQLSTDSAKVAGEVQEHKDEAKEKALQVADDAASATSKGSIYIFFGMALGALAAAFGAKKGRDSKVPDDYHAHYNNAYKDA